MPEYQTDVNKIDWNGTLHAVRDALQNLRSGWE